MCPTLDSQRFNAQIFCPLRGNQTQLMTESGIEIQSSKSNSRRRLRTEPIEVLPTFQSQVQTPVIYSHSECDESSSLLRSGMYDEDEEDSGPLLKRMKDRRRQHGMG